MINFTISAPSGALSTTPIGAVPGGFRLEVGYDAQTTFAGVDSTGDYISGHVVAGSDWVLLRDDGVAVFNAKITFEAKTPGSHVFDSVLSGRVALNALGWKRAIRTTAEWNLLAGTLDVSLPIQFETSGAPPDGASAVVKNTSRYWKTFDDLVKNQFVANGQIHVKAGAIESLELCVLPAKLVDHFAPIFGLIHDARQDTWDVTRLGLNEPVLKCIANVVKLYRGLPHREELLLAIDSLSKKNWVEAQKQLTELRTLMPKMGR